MRKAMCCCRASAALRRVRYPLAVYWGELEGRYPAGGSDSSVGDVATTVALTLALPTRKVIVGSPGSRVTNASRPRATSVPSTCHTASSMTSAEASATDPQSRIVCPAMYGLNRFLTRDMYDSALKDIGLGTHPWNTNRYMFGGGNPVSRIELDGHINDSSDGLGGDPYAFHLPITTSDEEHNQQLVENWKNIGAGTVQGIIETGEQVSPLNGIRQATGTADSQIYHNVASKFGANTDSTAYEAGRWFGSAIVPTGTVGIGVKVADRAAVTLSEKAAAKLADDAAKAASPEIGTKLEYFFGNATGTAHNIQRSGDMASQLNRIGIGDSAAGRAIFSKHLDEVFNDPGSVVRTQDNGRIVREGLLKGPDGMLKTETIWDGNRLITGQLYGSNSRYRK
ncbi:hypothetical protein ACFPJ1_09855 [Kribbella qitaiheensis]|uniref:hypothetical protein n=1 Tax=Kribbella qitaiheensis TaxID=1544730 RepID=UPI00360B573C